MSTLTLDLFEEATAPPPAPATSERETLYRRFIAAVAYQDQIGAQCLYSHGLPPFANHTHCARLVNLILRRVASDRPAVTPERVEEAIAHVGGFWQEVWRDPQGRERLWAAVRGEVA